jgi:hypothetical protein
MGKPKNRERAIERWYKKRMNENRDCPECKKKIAHTYRILKERK